MAVLKREEAPGDLELVRAFVNTRDLEAGRERIDSPHSLEAWLRDRDLLEPEEGVDEGDLQRALEVREAIRDLLRVNAGLSGESDAGTALDAAARRAGLTVRFEPDGEPRLVPTARGADAALGRILTALAGARAAGIWQRLKACADPGCEWAFYDHTKNRSGTWCDMAVCGNRAKARAYRERHGG